MLSLPSRFSKSGLASSICRKLKRINGALSNLVFEVLTLAALASSLARLQESPAPLALMVSLVDAKHRSLLREAQVRLYTRPSGNGSPSFPPAGSSV